jgi:hypothetical protein
MISFQNTAFTSQVLGYHVRTQFTANSMHQMLAVSGCSGKESCPHLAMKVSITAFLALKALLS